MKNLSKGDFVKHNIYGKGIITDIYKNLLGQTCYEVYFNGLAKRVTVMDKSSLEPDYSSILGIVDPLELKHKSSEDVLDQIHGIIGILTDNDGDLPNAHKEDAKKRDNSHKKQEECPTLMIKRPPEGNPFYDNAAAPVQETENKTSKSNEEAINHPFHYNTGKIEVIDYIESLGLGVGFNLGNAIKYLSRAGHKIKNSEKQDVEKALWYIKRQRESWEKEWHLFSTPTKNKINSLRYIDDKRLSYCLGSAIDFIDASLSTGSKSIAIANLKQAENALSFWLETYCGNEKG